MIFTNRRRAGRMSAMPIQYTGTSTNDSFSHKFRTHIGENPPLSSTSTPLQTSLTPLTNNITVAKTKQPFPSRTPRPLDVVPPTRARTVTASLRALTSDHSPDSAKNAATDKPIKKMRWGEPTWFLFHTLAEKIKESEFPVLRTQLFDLVENICTNLPCPICSTHAKAYLAGTNFANITTKDHFRIFFLRFHNEVNRRKGYPLFAYEDLADKYGKANTVAIIHHFMAHFEDRNPSNARMIADTLYRQRLVSVLKAWFSKNIQSFEL